MTKKEKLLNTFIPLETFKALMGIDDREDKIACFCLITATLTIEQYCRRKLLRKKHFELIEYTGDLFLPLSEYPVNKILATYSMNNEQRTENNGEIVEPEFFRVIPDCGTEIDMPHAIEFSPALRRYRGLSAFKVIYEAGYITENSEQRTMNKGKKDKSKGDIFGQFHNNEPLYVPADLASACMELAAWNMNRYRGRRIGMTGNIRGAGIQGEHFELAMPENVRLLLEPYRRRVI